MLPSVDLICLPIGWFLVMMPNFIKVSYMRQLKAMQGSTYAHSDYNAAPRQATKKIIEEGGEIGAAVARCDAAHANGWESLLLFAIGVFAARFGLVTNDNRTIASIVYVVARTLYNLAYCLGKGTVTAGNTRSLLWMVGLGASLYLQIAGAVGANQFPFTS